MLHSMLILKGEGMRAVYTQISTALDNTYRRLEEEVLADINRLSGRQNLLTN